MLTNREFHLQTGNLAYKTGFSFTKRDSWVTKGILGLLFTNSLKIVAQNAPILNTITVISHFLAFRQSLYTYLQIFQIFLTMLLFQQYPYLESVSVPQACIYNKMTEDMVPSNETIYCNISCQYSLFRYSEINIGSVIFYLLFTRYNLVLSGL